MTRHIILIAHKCFKFLLKLSFKFGVIYGITIARKVLWHRMSPSMIWTSCYSDCASITRMHVKVYEC